MKPKNILLLVLIALPLHAMDGEFLSNLYILADGIASSRGNFHHATDNESVDNTSLTNDQQFFPKKESSRLPLHKKMAVAALKSRHISLKECNKNNN